MQGSIEAASSADVVLSAGLRPSFFSKTPRETRRVYVLAQEPRLRNLAKHFGSLTDLRHDAALPQYCATAQALGGP
jgi:hypothetical protein